MDVGASLMLPTDGLTMLDFVGNWRLSPRIEKNKEVWIGFFAIRPHNPAFRNEYLIHELNIYQTSDYCKPNELEKGQIGNASMIVTRKLVTKQGP